MNEYLAMWKNFANFSDRTSRRGYWMAFLINFIISLVLGVIIAVLPKLGFISYIYSLAALIPSLAIAVRRLRDAGKQWGWLFICFVPLVGWIILLIMLCTPSASNGATV